MKTRIGVVAVSDRASTGVYEDKGIPAICAFLDTCITSEYEYVTRLIPDEQDTISDTLVELADVEHCSLIVTTGGTGPALRDVTPEATEAVCQKMLPGFGELMRQVSLQIVPTAILSRQSAGIRGTSLIINLPGKPTAIAECLVAVMPAVPDCISVIGGSAITLNDKFGTYLPHSS
jgi:molybdopterin adenylyltransferase